MSMLLIDFSNAFNMVSKYHLIKEVRLHCPGISHWVEFCYMRPATLYYAQYILSSALRVQQGDPLGPLIFSLTLHPLVKTIASRCKHDLHSWYLDDGTIIGDTLEVSKALRLIETEGPGRGLHLNIKKTEVFWPSIDPKSTVDGIFPTDIGRPSNGVKILGGPVSLDLNFISDMMLSRVNKTVQLMSAIKKLKDPQSEMLLLRNFTGVSRLYFAMRTTNPAALQKATELFDDHLLKYLRLLVTGDGPSFGPLQRRLATLPIKDGGLGIYTMADTRTYCYLASQSHTSSVQKVILGNLFNALLIIWLFRTSSSGLNQCLGPRQFRYVLCYRLGIPLFVENGLCSSCSKSMDIFGDHALHCDKDVGIKLRHDFVRDIVADICYKAGVPARKEVSLGFLSDDDKGLRPADILVLNWENGKVVCMDVTGVSPFTGDGIRSFVPGKAISSVVSRECTKYLDKCVSHGYDLGVLAFSTLGELGEDTLYFFKRLKNYLVSNDASSGFDSFIFHRLGIVIQKGRGINSEGICQKKEGDIGRRLDTTKLEKLELQRTVIAAHVKNTKNISH
ncbi:uncharacterized protein LOC113295035 [Papaver somniferum]|uniref:uncharacterized protein LOC113295035 n=1 Tax=Papaver somniferum TaxID=3469 RepID=UPI000E6FD1B8|nr:uncharacterized protein LOC113295035 [Papaver somniferum]